MYMYTMCSSMSISFLPLKYCISTHTHTHTLCHPILHQQFFLIMILVKANIVQKCLILFQLLQAFCTVKWARFACIIDYGEILRGLFLSLSFAMVYQFIANIKWDTNFARLFTSIKEINMIFFSFRSIIGFSLSLFLSQSKLHFNPIFLVFHTCLDCVFQALLNVQTIDHKK